ncbi:MAG: hypothetical protein IJQ31_07290 [Thermoguttaceae bacterium]|nr:hypothetical protein [Thermoguttaceae bacterium]
MGRFFTWIGNLLKSCIEGIISFLISIWNFFWNILVGIGNFFVDIWNYVWDWLQWAFYSCIDWILRQFVNFLDLIADNINLNIDLSGFNSIFQTIAQVNLIFPVDTVLTCSGIYTTVLLVWVVYKFIKSWIPTVSGT